MVGNVKGEKRMSDVCYDDDDEDEDEDEGDE